jgi:hypothetical protein
MASKSAAQRRAESGGSEETQAPPQEEQAAQEQSDQPDAQSRSEQEAAAESQESAQQSEHANERMQADSREQGEREQELSGGETPGEGEQDVERIGHHDTLSDIKAALGPLQPMAVDASGVSRIIGPAVDDTWQPAQVEPDPEAVAHQERVREAQYAHRERGLGATQANPENIAQQTEVTRRALAAERGE